MLKSPTKVSLFFRFRGWMFVCVRTRNIDDRFLALLRPWVFAGFACWFDRRDDIGVHDEQEPAYAGSDHIS
jgi:hypothetical protein